MYMQTTHSFTCRSSQTVQKGETESKCDMQRFIRALRAWMVEDKLKLNEEKTEFMIIGTRQQLSKVRTDSLLVSDMPVPSVT